MDMWVGVYMCMGVCLCFGTLLDDRTEQQDSTVIHNTIFAYFVKLQEEKVWLLFKQQKEK